MATESLTPREVIHHLLERARAELGIDLCFVGEISGNRRTFRFINGDAESFGVELGTVEPADATYCQRVLDGVLPPILPDARKDARTAALPVTNERDIGAFASFPILLPSGRVYGTLCALGHEANPQLDERDIRTMRLIAGMIGEQLAKDIEATEESEEIAARVRSVLDDPSKLEPVYQPIVHLDEGPVGFEALSRFPDRRPPNVWFEEAWSVGLGVELEIAAAARAAEALERIPEQTYLSMNASPETLLSQDFAGAGYTVNWGQLVVEITEHASVTNYEQMQQALVGLLDLGVRLAIDDAGAGFSSLSHIMELSPDIIKLDIVFTRGIDSDPTRRALTSAMLAFSREIDAVLVAEGVETADELATLQKLGVGHAQGYYLGRPAPLAAFQ